MPEAERPNRVLLVIITDGEENASVEYTRDRVFSMISTQQDVYGWSFLFLAANQDAIAEAAKVGIDAQQSLNFAATGAGIRAASLAMSDAVSSFRATGDAALAGSAPKKKRKVH